MKNQRYQKYYAFIKTVELGGLTKATKLMGYTQSGISHMIHSLEEEVGIKLLHRDRSGVRLTTEGEILLPYFVDICNSEQRLDNKIQDVMQMDTGLIRIGTVNSVAVQWLPYIMKEFLEDFPKIEFEIMYGDYAEIEKWILDGKVDFGFLRIPEKDMLKTVFLAEDELVVILPADHPLKDQDFFPPEAFEIYPYALLDEGEDYEQDAIFDHFHVQPRIRFTAKDDLTLGAMVSNGLAISIMSRLVIRNMPHEFIQKPFPEPIFRQLGLAYKDKKYLSNAAERFIDYVIDWVGRNF